MNIKIKEAATAIRADFDALRAAIGTSPAEAAKIIKKVIDGTGIFDSGVKMGDAERAYADIVKEIREARRSVTDSPADEYLKAAKTLAGLRIYHEQAVHSFRANLDIVETELREIAKRAAEYSGECEKKLVRLEAKHRDAMFAVAFSHAVTDISSTIERLSTSLPGREKPALRMLAARFADLAKLMETHGDVRADGIKMISSLVKKSITPTK